MEFADQETFQVNSAVRLYKHSNGKWVTQILSYQGGHKRGTKPFKVWGKVELYLTKDDLLKIMEIMEG